MKRPVLVFALCIACSWFTLAQGREPEGWTPAPRKIDGLGDGYAGTAACQTCHADAHADWMGSSHANTFEPVSEDNLPGEVLSEETAIHAPGKSRFRKHAHGFEVETVGPDGKPTWFPLTHVVGRMRVRMYVATLPDGRMQVLPGMLQEPTGRWFDYTKLIFSGSTTDFQTAPIVKPEDGSFWTGPIRAWEPKCARCHTSGHAFLPVKAGQVGLRATSRQLGIDCEMCHGPSQAHVKHHREHVKGPDPLQPFSSLSRNAQISVCLRCHMEAEIDDPNFTVGDDIFEHVTPTLMLSPERMDPYGRQLELIYDGVPFSSSRCAEEGGLTCVSCHDPHGSPHPSQLRTAPDDDTMCVRCHEKIGNDIAAHAHHPVDSIGARCVSCHMPFLAVERDQGIIADHTISIPRLGLPGDRVAQDACSRCHAGGLWAPEEVRELDASALKDAYAEWWPEAQGPALWQRALAAARAGEADAAPALVAVANDTSAPRVARASATRLLDRYGKDGAFALMMLTGDEDSLVRRSAFTALAGTSGGAVDALFLRGLTDPSIPVRNAAANAAVAGWSRVQANRPLLLAAIPVLEAYAATDPGQEQRWFTLGAAFQIAGDRAGAIRAYERYLVLYPGASLVRSQVETLKAKK